MRLSLLGAIDTENQRTSGAQLQGVDPDFRGQRDGVVKHIRASLQRERERGGGIIAGQKMCAHANSLPSQEPFVIRRARATAVSP